MFKFLKEKLKNAISSITKKIEKIPVEEAIEEVVIEKKPERKKAPKIIKEKPKEEKKGFFQKIREKVQTTRINEKEFEEIFYDLEIALFENNTAVEVVEKIKRDLKENLVDKPIERKKIKTIIQDTLKETLYKILEVPKLDLIKMVKEIKKEGKPYVILILGYNGSGKSITAAKLAKYFQNNKLRPILGAGDTFRAAGAIQLGEYGKMVNVPVIKQEIGSDSCAVIFDTISSAKARDYDVVIADTAGRIHTNLDLMEELKKIVRVNKPDLKVLVLDALTGSDIIEQTEQFENAIGVDALILTKVDAYEKGGSILSAAYLLKKSILFLGSGQKMDSLKEYNIKEILENLGLDGE